MDIERKKIVSIFFSVEIFSTQYWFRGNKLQTLKIKNIKRSSPFQVYGVLISIKFPRFNNRLTSKRGENLRLSQWEDGVIRIIHVLDIQYVLGRAESYHCNLYQIRVKGRVIYKPSTTLEAHPVRRR